MRDMRRIEALSRRDLLKQGLAAGAALTTGRQLLAATAPDLDAPRDRSSATADAMILLWMGGGQAQTETWDVKRYSPYEPGMESKGCLSTFHKIPTSADGIEISEGMPLIARTMHLATLIRSVRPEDLAVRLHTPSQHHFHTGYAPPVGVQAPSMGAWIARLLGRKHPEVPPYFDIGRTVGSSVEAFEVRAYHTGGFLGTGYGPFIVSDPLQAVATLRPASGMSQKRFAERWKMYQAVSATQARRTGDERVIADQVQAMREAEALMHSPAAEAFDLQKEGKERYDAYNTGRFGLSCLLGRRLIEAGARFVEVEYEFIPFKGWDTHEDGHTRTANMMAEIDRPISQLIADLRERGLLERTLIVLASEFGRDAVIDGDSDGETQRATTPTPDKFTEEKHYGMHQHFSAAMSAVMWGGGARGGYLHGATADERPCMISEKPVPITDLHATMYKTLGIAADEGAVVEQRPFFVTKDARGQVVSDVLA